MFHVAVGTDLSIFEKPANKPEMDVNLGLRAAKLPLPASYYRAPWFSIGRRCGRRATVEG
jgi:hypothetical protein